MAKDDSRTFMGNNDLGFLAMTDKGRLVFQDDVSTPSRLSYSSSLREALACRVFVVSVSLVLYGVLISMFLHKSVSLTGTFVLLLAITVMLIMDSQLFARNEHSARHMRIYEKGIEMPTTWFERNLLKRGFVQWEDIGTIFAVRHNIMEELKIVRGVESEIVLVTKDGITYSSWAKDRKEVQKALEVISNLWPKLSYERTRVERLEEKRMGFSRGFASVSPTSLLIPVLIIDALLVTALGASLLTSADISITIVAVSFIVILDLVFGYLLARVSMARRKLMATFHGS